MFEERRQRRYPRELLFSTVVDLMTWVASGLARRCTRRHGRWRRIEFARETPTDAGERAIRLWSNLPEEIGAQRVAALDRGFTSQGSPHFLSV